MTEEGNRLSAMCTTENLLSTGAEGHGYFYIMRYVRVAEMEATKATRGVMGEYTGIPTLTPPTWQNHRPFQTTAW